MAKKAQKSWTRRVSGLKNPIPIAEYSRKVFPILSSKTATKKAINGGRLFLNGKKARSNDTVKNGDQLKLEGFGIQRARSFEADLDIVYEDDFFIIVNKPAGIAVNGNRIKTVENALAGVAEPSSQADALPRPVAVHRIDVPTKGLVLLAKAKSALVQLAEAFQHNRVKKEYMAVVHGKAVPKGRITLPVKGKKAVTDYQTLKVVPSQVFKNLSLVRLMPVTGRTHQLRIHLKQQGHLIVGDKMYADQQDTILGKGLFLCAYRLQFTHPDSGLPVDVKIDPPNRFQKLLAREEKRYQ